MLRAVLEIVRGAKATGLKADEEPMKRAAIERIRILKKRW
jgi:hypothetical protein